MPLSSSSMVAAVPHAPESGVALVRAKPLRSPSPRADSARPMPFVQWGIYLERSITSAGTTIRAVAERCGVDEAIVREHCDGIRDPRKWTHRFPPTVSAWFAIEEFMAARERGVAVSPALVAIACAIVDAERARDAAAIDGGGQ